MPGIAKRRSGRKRTCFGAKLEIFIFVPEIRAGQSPAPDRGKRNQKIRMRCYALACNLLACLLENSTWWLRSSSIADESAIFWKREHKNTIGGIAVKIISRLFPVNFLQINIITWFSIMSTRANRKVQFYSLLLMFFILLVFYSPREGRSERESECRLQCPNGGEWNQIAETWFSYLSRKQFPFHVVQRIFTYILPSCNQDNPVRYRPWRS